MVFISFHKRNESSYVFYVTEGVVGQHVDANGKFNNCADTLRTMNTCFQHRYLHQVQRLFIDFCIVLADLVRSMSCIRVKSTVDRSPPDGKHNSMKSTGIKPIKQWQRSNGLITVLFSVPWRYSLARKWGMIYVFIHRHLCHSSFYQIIILSQSSVIHLVSTVCSTSPAHLSISPFNTKIMVDSKVESASWRSSEPSRLPLQFH